MMEIKKVPLMELKRQEIINRVKSDHETRFERRLDYDMEDVRVSDPGELYRGDFRIFVEIGDYEATLLLEDFLPILKKHASPEDTDLYQKVKDALREAVNEVDLSVHCTCPDFRYRFQFMATQQGYLANPPGEPESRPPDQRNPQREGAVCKHLAHLLNYPSEWYPYVTKYIRGMIDFDRSLLEGLMKIMEDASVTQPADVSGKKKGDVSKRVHRPADLMSILRNWINRVSGSYTINDEESNTLNMVFDVDFSGVDNLESEIDELDSELQDRGYEVSDYSDDRIVVSLQT